MGTSLLLKFLAAVISITAFTSVGLLTAWSILDSQDQMAFTFLFCILLGFYIYSSVYLFGSQRSEESKLSSIGIYGVLGLIPVAISLAALILLQNQRTTLAYLLATFAVASQIICLIVVKISLNVIDRVANDNNYRSDHMKWKGQINELRPIAEQDEFRERLAELAEAMNYLSRAPSAIDLDLGQKIDQHIKNIKHSLETKDLSMFTFECNELEKNLEIRQNNLKLDKEKI